MSSSIRASHHALEDAIPEHLSIYNINVKGCYTTGTATVPNTSSVSSLKVCFRPLPMSEAPQISERCYCNWNDSVIWKPTEAYTSKPPMRPCCCFQGRRKLLDMHTNHISSVHSTQRFTISQYIIIRITGWYECARK